jgi:hypothetical protein
VLSRVAIVAFVVVASLARTAAAQDTVTAQPADGNGSDSAHVQIADVLPPPQAPAAKLTPEEMPPTVPKVSYVGGQLTIVSTNSTLGQILSAVRASTGADIDIPANLSDERVAAQVGPGPARQVLATLLSGTEFNFVIRAVDGNPQAIQSIVLMQVPKAADADGGSASNNNRGHHDRRGMLTNTPEPAKDLPFPVQSVLTDTATTNDTSTTDGDSAATAQQAPPGDSPAKEQQPSKHQQLVQDLQSMYQQRRQMNQQQLPPKAE